MASNRCDSLLPTRLESSYSTRVGKSLANVKVEMWCIVMADDYQIMGTGSLIR